jgi:SAM-dependent methyltransferase
MTEPTADHANTGADTAPDVAAAQLEADSYSDAGDSGYGDEISQYAESLTSSKEDYPEAYGRRYHAFRRGRYALPNDEEEGERLDIHHAVIRTAMHDKLFLAPLGETPKRVIDIGTGTGIWAIEFADENPTSEIIGNDLSPTPPSFVPPNVEFLVDDVEDQWLYGDRPFDFVHGRFLAGAIRDWPNLIRQAYDCTRSGGWVEFQDWDTFLYSHDQSLPPDSAIAKFHIMAGGVRESQGYDMKPGRSLDGWLRDAGFVNVKSQKMLLPLGPWPKDRHAKTVGVYNLLQMQTAIEGICLGTLPHAPQPWSDEEIQIFLAQIRNDMRNRKIHAQYDL